MNRKPQWYGDTHIGETIEPIPVSEELQKVIDMNAAIVQMNAEIVKVLCSYTVFGTTGDSGK